MKFFYRDGMIDGMDLDGIYQGVVSGLDDQRERRNFIALAYACHVPDDYQIDNKEKTDQDAGFLKWFHELPDDFLPIHDCYRKEWNKLKRRYEDAIME